MLINPSKEDLAQVLVRPVGEPWPVKFLGGAPAVHGFIACYAPGAALFVSREARVTGDPWLVVGIAASEVERRVRLGGRVRVGPRTGAAVTLKFKPKYLAEGFLADLAEASL